MEYEKGETVRITERVTRDSVDGYRTVQFEEDQEVVITRVNTNMVIVRGENKYGARGEEASIWLEYEYIAPNDPNAPRPRALGEVPEGAISPDDPGLKWFWEDAAKLAVKRSLCGVYDDFVKALGAPGRPQNYTASIQVGKISMTGRYLCQSQKEADELLRAELVESGVILPENVLA